jgi:hypothetical protein
MNTGSGQSVGSGGALSPVRPPQTRIDVGGSAETRPLHITRGSI